MAFVTKAENDLRVHEFLDRIKKRAIDWIAAGNELLTSDSRYGDEIVELRFIKATPPPKTYTFAEAYAMMKQGNWMRPANANHCRRFSFMDGLWVYRTPSMTTLGRFNDWSAQDVDDQWVGAN